MTCDLVFSADDVARALDGEAPDGCSADEARAHIAQCASCLRVARARAAAKGAWRRAKEDRASSRNALEQRLEKAWRVPRATSRLALATSAAVGGLAVAAATALFAPHPKPATPRPTVAARRAHAIDSSRSVRARAALVAVTPCARCSVPMEAGDVVEPGTRVELPGGARLTLGWVLEEGMIDLASGVDLEGPASFARGEDGLVVFEGIARVRARGHTEAVEGPHVHTEGEDAAWTLRVHGGVARVEAARGQVLVDARGERTTLRAGAAIELGAAPERAPVTDAPKETAVDESELWRAAQDALRRGDRAAATSAFDEVARRATSPRLRAGASFALAELALARGARGDAELRLSDLLRDPDPDLAADAAFLLARTADAPRARAEIWARYLATSPPSPRREDALAARAEALFDAGDPDAARAIAEDLHRATSLSPSARRALARLDARRPPSPPPTP